MPRGGYRKNAGRKTKWKHGKTTSIRVPIVLANQILEIAQKIDKDQLLEIDTKSNLIDLSGIQLISVRGQKAVILVELMKAGYEIYPLSLAKSLRKEYLKNQNESE